MALIFALAAIALSWLGQGHPLQPAWTLTILPLGLWLVGMSLGRRIFFFLGFLGLCALATECVFAGNVSIALGVLGLSLFAWDCLPSYRLPHRDKKEKFVELCRVCRWSGLVVGTGVALAFAASFLRFFANFWAIVGTALLAWLFLRAFLREVVQGGETKGNRSTSKPTE